MPRMSELLGTPVLDAEGTSRGRVKDVRVVQDGPYVEGFGAALRVEGILTGRGTAAVLLGFDRAGVKGPWPLVSLFRRLEHRATYYSWEEIETWDDGVVRLRAGAEPEAATPAPSTSTTPTPGGSSASGDSSTGS